MTDEEIANRLSRCELGDSRGAFAAGTLFGDWRLTAFISRGGTSEVYVAEHIALGTPAAVKILMGTDPARSTSCQFAKACGNCMRGVSSIAT